MKKQSFLLIVSSCALLSANAQKSAHTTKTVKKTTNSIAQKGTITSGNVLKTEADSISYALGLGMTKFYKTQGIDNLVPSAVSKGVSDGSGKATPLLTDAQVEGLMNKVYQKVEKEKLARTEAEAAPNIAAGKAFLAKNKTQPGVVELPDGLQYKIINPGKGQIPTDTNTVKVHYKGTLIDGTVFDSSIDRGEPISIPVNGVIRGWTEALKLMPVGSKWTLYIPSDLAYGNRSAGPVIKAGSTLIFDVELISIEK